MNRDKLGGLDQFTGGDQQFIHPISGIRYTEGIRLLAEHGDCYWLIDAIASYQPQLMRMPALRQFQCWDLKVHPDKSCVLSCREDTDIEPVVRQEIQYTDFPLAQISLWVEQGVLLLPSEH